MNSALLEQGLACYLLDGDNICRIDEVAKLYFDAGVVVLIIFVSPFKADGQGGFSHLTDKNRAD